MDKDATMICHKIGDNNTNNTLLKIANNTLPWNHQGIANKSG